jgi:hypothetical protein
MTAHVADKMAESIRTLLRTDASLQQKDNCGTMARIFKRSISLAPTQIVKALSWPTSWVSRQQRRSR